MTAVIVLNASYEVLDKVAFSHAVKMLFRQVAEVVESDEGKMIGPHPWPRVIRLVRYVARKWLDRPVNNYSRHNVLRRDKHRCAYCGGHATTIDHVVPQASGGRSTYLNTVAACRDCNHRKGSKSLAEAGMRLRFEPRVPTRAEVYVEPAVWVPALVS